MDSPIDVVPYEYVNTETVSKIRINIINIVLFTSVTVNAVLFNQSNHVVTSKNFVLAGENYTQWGYDDRYIVTYVCNQLGITLTTPLV